MREVWRGAKYSSSYYTKSAVVLREEAIMIKANSHEIEIEANYLKLLRLSVVGPSANHIRGLLF